MIRALHIMLAALLCAAPAPAAPPEPPASSPVVVRFQIDVTDGGHTLIHEVDVDAPIAAVWKAISTPEGWRTWAVPAARLVGGDPNLLETSYDPSAEPGGPATIRQSIVARIPGRMLAFRTVKAPEGFPDFDTYSKVVSVFELEALAPERTRVRLTGSSYPNTEAGHRLFTFFQRGNRSALDMLRRRFAEGPADWSKERLSK